PGRRTPPDAPALGDRAGALNNERRAFPLPVDVGGDGAARSGSAARIAAGAAEIDRVGRPRISAREDRGGAGGGATRHRREGRARQPRGAQAADDRLRRGSTDGGETAPIT